MGCFSNDQPPAPDYAAANRAGVEADIATLPQRRLIEAQARAGEGIFAGLGDADITAAESDKLAGAALALRQKYGTDFINQSLRELEQSDPQGAAARRQLFAMVSQDAPGPSATALEMDRQISEQLAAGGGLTDDIRREVEQASLANQTAAGNVYGMAPAFQRVMEIGTAAENRRRANQASAAAWLSSGSAPDDVTYKRTQQKMGNLGAFMSGQTPTAQFSSLTGAQAGAVPNQSYGPLKTNVNQNAGAQSAQFAQQNYAQEMGWASQQQNPWVTGIGLGIKAIAAIRGSGGMTS
jgi:hypothetical protein